MIAKKIYVGGWFQRTVLHLIEVYDFLLGKESPLHLDQKKLDDFKKTLNVKNVDLIVTGMDYVHIETNGGIEIKLYEDGLIVLSTMSESMNDDIQRLTDFYEQKLSPTINYLFSLGAPVPKELAGIRTVYPYFIVLQKSEPSEIKGLLNEFQQEVYLEIKGDGFEIYRGDKLYVINNMNVQDVQVENLVNEQIFFREFEGQLHRYLNIHRNVWEKIAKIKERKKISGKEIVELKEKIDKYAKTISLIEGRLNQMDTYIDTRSRMVKGNKLFAELEGDLQFKYDTLRDTLEYLLDLWGTTQRYVSSAQQLFSELNEESTKASVNNLAVITAMSLGATLMQLFVVPESPMFGLRDLAYFLGLLLVGIIANVLIKIIYQKRRYKISDTKIAKDL